VSAGLLPPDRTERYGLFPTRKEPALFIAPVRLRALVTPVAMVAYVFVAVVACDRTRAPRTAALTLDDFADTVRTGTPATRIVSLSPVTTEILFALGAGHRVVGRTHWDLYPDAARAVTDVGNGMQPNVEAVLGVRPDLVVLYASNTNRGAAKQLRAAGVATLALRTDHVADFRRTVILRARAIDDPLAGTRLADSVENSMRAVRARPRPATPPTVFWFIWESPLYTIGRNSYMSELVDIAGARNIFADLDAVSPQVTREEIVKRNPDFILTGPENAAKLRASSLWQAVPAVREGRILVVDTTLVGRPGVRLGEAARHLRALILHDTLR
jgi:ABC-type Fe3+-hydroxamate transport system substrate-binding protein